MNADRSTETIVEAWLADGFTTRPDAESMLRTVRTVVASTPQRRHRWWPSAHIPRSRAHDGGAVPTGGWTVVVAVRLLAAGVIVALFGGLLLAGIISTPQGEEMAPAAGTASPSPMTTEELLSGMVSEEVAPGVLHILNDGVRDISPLGGGRYWGEAVVVDGTGAVWRIVQLERYFRLGEEEEWPIGQWTDLAVAGGRLVTDFDELTDLLGPQSATLEELGLDRGLSFIEAQADGTLWLLGEVDGLVRVPPGGVAEATAWRDVYDGRVDGFLVTPDGDAWLMGRPEAGLNPVEVFLHFDGTDWEIVPVPVEMVPGPGEGWRGSDEMFDVGPDGMLWTVGDAVLPHGRLARYDGTGWTIFGPADGVRPWGSQRVGAWNMSVDAVRVAPDGSAWVSATGPGDWGCGGLGRFDGESWASFLPGTCIAYYDIAPDGAVWVVASVPPVAGSLDTETYVITPEAVAAIG